MHHFVRNEMVMVEGQRINCLARFSVTCMGRVICLPNIIVVHIY
jgi:hypothetical protein